MPTIIVEDGTGLSSANSYVTLEEADAYFESHAFYADNWEELGAIDKERLLVTASRQLDALVTWRGFIVFSAQGLGWPRSGVIDDEGRLVARDYIPSQIKEAVCELAFYLSRGDPYAATSSEGIERLKIDVIELQFTGSAVVRPVPMAALLVLKGLVESTFNTRVRRVITG